MPEDKIPLAWSNGPSCLLINMDFVGTESGVSWRIEKELKAAKNVRVMLGDGQHTFILAGLTSRTEAMYIFSVNGLPEEMLHCRNPQVLMKSYYLPALARLTRMIWLLALPTQNIPRRPLLRFPKMACVIFHMADEHLMEQRCLRGFFGSAVTENNEIGKVLKKLSIAYRHKWTRNQILKTHQVSLPPVRPLTELQNVTALLAHMRRETAFARLNKHSDDFRYVLEVLIKPPYLVSEDKIIGLSS